MQERGYDGRGKKTQERGYDGRVKKMQERGYDGRGKQTKNGTKRKARCERVQEL